MKRFAMTLGMAASLPAMAQAECAEASQRDLTVSAAWSRVTIGTARPAVFYVTIQNDGSTDDRLIGIETPVAGMPMLHETVMSDGVASMPHADQIAITAGETVRLALGSDHGMLMDRGKALTEGKSYPMTLRFQNAGAVTIDTDVVSIRERKAPCVPAP